jgi:hypothetical protein
LGAQPGRRTHSDQAGRAMRNGYIETFNGECSEGTPEPAMF